MKQIILTILLTYGYSAFANIQCRELLDDSKRIEETKKVILSALNTKKDDQTRSLLSYMRLMIKNSQEHAIRLLSANGVSIAEVAAYKPDVDVKTATALLEEYETRSNSGSADRKNVFKSLLGKRQLSIEELAKKIKQTAETLKNERVKLEQKSDQILNLISSTRSGIASLEGEIRFMENLYTWLLSIKGIESNSTIELHQFGLGVQDQIALLKQQVKGLEDQIETLGKGLAILNPIVAEVNQFLNFSYLMVSPKITLQLKNTQAKKAGPKALGYTTLTPEVMSQFFRPFHNGDHVRAVKTGSNARHVSRKKFYSGIGIYNATFEIIRTDSHTKYITSTKEKMPDRKFGLFKLTPTVLTNEDINTLSVEYDEGYFTSIYLSNPVMELNGVRVDDILDLEPIGLNLDGFKTVSDDFKFLGRVIGTRLHTDAQTKTLRVVGVEAFFYDPVSRNVTQKYYGEITEEDLLKTKIYKKADEEL